MDAIDEFPSAFWKATDLVGKKVTVTITGAVKEVMNDGKAKLILSFKEDTRRLVLNGGNRTELVERFGRDTAQWLGKTVTLIAMRVQGPNGLTWGVRFEPPAIDADIDDAIPPVGGGTATNNPPRNRTFN